MRRLGSLIALSFAFALLFAAGASAATRYAAPGGTGVDPCEDPAEPCNFYEAADYRASGSSIEAGDIVEMAPGTYSEADGDLGPSFTIQPPAAVVVRGEPGKARPLIVLEVNNGGWGAFFVGPGTEIFDVEVRNQAANGSAISLQGGVVDRVVARNSVSTAFTCTSFEGTMLNSACINSAGGTAIGVSVLTAGSHASILRNSTFIATGPGSVGMDFAYFASNPGVVGGVSGVGVIAKGEAKDVIARGLEYNSSGQGASTTIELQASDYATTDTKTSGPGFASVTTPGTNGNITDVPLLAADNVHQLSGSPTIDKGAVDGASSLLDIDWQLREIGLAPDIGADELGNPTSSSVSCSPTTIAPAAKSSCTVTVVDTGTALTQPTGDISLTPVPGLDLPAGCSLVPDHEDSAICSFTAIGTAVGGHTIAASYAGDAGHEGNQGSAVVTVADPPPSGSGSDRKGKDKGKANPAPSTQLGKHPPKLTKKRKAKFTFTSNEPTAHFECKLDKKPFRVCASPYKRKVKLGPHKFQVRAVDAQGKADATPAVFRWKVIRAS